MFISIEGNDCIFLQDVIALVHQDGRTFVYYADGRVDTTRFRPVTLARRYDRMMKEALHPPLQDLQEGHDQ